MNMKGEDGRRPMLEGAAFDEELARLDPRHWPEAIRRAEALRSYLSMSASTVADAERVAAGLGVSVTRLYQVVRRWRDSGSLSSLAPQADRPRTPRLDPATAGVIDEVTDALLARDPDATADDVLRQVLVRLRDAGLPRTSRPTVRLRFERRLAERGGRPRPSSAARRADRGRSRLVVDRGVVGVPILTADGPALPLVAFAIDPDAGTMAATRAVPDAEPHWISAALVLADALTGRRPEDGIPRTVEVDRDASPRWLGLSALLRSHDVILCARRVPRPGSGSRFRRHVGSSLAAVPMITRGAARAGSERYLRWRAGRTVVPEPMGIAELMRVLRAAARVHNRARGASVGETSEPSDRAAAMARELREWASDVA